MEGGRVERRGDWTSGRGDAQGSFFGFQKVPLKVLGEVLGESLSQVESSSHVVSSSPIWTSTERTPSLFLNQPMLSARTI